MEPSKGFQKVAVLVIVVIVGAAVYFLLNGAQTTEAPVTNTNSEESPSMLTLSSPVFNEGESIPSQYTCDGENIIPPLTIKNVPNGARALTLIMDDPDIPDSVKESMGIEVFDHWVVFNIPPTTNAIEEGQAPDGIHGVNSSGEPAYTGPCPPDGQHRYFFKLYALDTELNLTGGATKEEVEQAMEGHVLEETELMGVYEREG